MTGGSNVARCHAYSVLVPGFAVARLYWKAFGGDPISDDEIFRLLCRVSLFELLSAAKNIRAVNAPLTEQNVILYAEKIRADLRKRGRR